jgi:hypothetical protein
MTNLVGAWIVEFLKRFALKSPAFYQVLQTIGLIAMLITGIPAFIEWLNADFGVNVTLPDFWLAIESKVIAWCGFITWIISKTPVDNREELTRVEKREKLPYTSKKQ